ncbi:MAG TPA: NADH-quinone oxidoreductase subunit L, partial [Terracidiphilus sp.]
FAVTLGLIGTPAWPWFRAFLESRTIAGIEPEPGVAILMISSTAVVLLGLGLGWWVYGNKTVEAEAPDALEKALPSVWAVLRDKFYIDELYGVTFIAFYKWWARVADWFDKRVWGGLVALVMWVFGLLARFNRFFDNEWVNGGFDKGCEELYDGGGLLSRVESGRTQTYLRLLAVAVVVLAVILIWSSRP